MTQWETYTRLVREGRSVADLADTFGMPEPMVKRILALGNLLPRIRSLYAKEKISSGTVRHLTMASKSQQRAWLALFDDPQTYCPQGNQLKGWLFGGGAIRAEHALFDVEASGLAIIADLFGDDRYFRDSDAFWAVQLAAIEDRRLALLVDGWSDVVVLPKGDNFRSWEFRQAAKRKGGRIYIEVRDSGEIDIHEGYVTAKEAARLDKGEKIEAAPKAARPELTARMQTYVDLHRHAAVRAALTGHPAVALRLMVAHAVAGSPLWNVRIEPQAAKDEDVRESVEVSRAGTAFDEKRRAVLALLGFDAEEPSVTGGNPMPLAALFQRLLHLPDRAVMDVIAIVIGEKLFAGSAAVETVGLHIGLDMAKWWSADGAFFEGLRDREVLTALVAEVGGTEVAAANAKEKGTTLKAIIRDHVEGINGRTKVEDWVPKWMAFPPAAYTTRGGVGSVAAHSELTVPETEGEPQRKAA
ncbi:MAG TPA: chromosome partitioning protein ParB [Sphingopyxis sp.]|uniref:chromosome partitioning protein ParB n=1 Tax=Sphingopyxis sp. TaxID=1908224 RepID=UPI002C430ACA|nr:chromosome partitioning protein ParB [Sphingopyxis sp.]HWW59339.1 chromosome partitioning protein ParB [Sphingopyxis sp.]